MKKLATNIVMLCIASLLGSSVSFAQTLAPAAPGAPAAPAAAAPAAAKPMAPAAAPEKAPKAAKAAKPTKTMAPQSAKAKECSMKADEQKLHGKERKKFRAECKKAA